MSVYNMKHRNFKTYFSGDNSIVKFVNISGCHLAIRFRKDRYYMYNDMICSISIAENTLV